jgi:RNA-binding protein 26
VILTKSDGSQQGHAKGTNLPTVGKIEVTWYAPGPGPSKSIPSEQSAPVVMGGETASVGNAPADKGGPEEETVASGWGDDGEDGMGLL